MGRGIGVYESGPLDGRTREKPWSRTAGTCTGHDGSLDRVAAEGTWQGGGTGTVGLDEDEGSWRGVLAQMVCENPPPAHLPTESSYTPAHTVHPS